MDGTSTMTALARRKDEARQLEIEITIACEAAAARRCPR